MHLDWNPTEDDAWPVLGGHGLIMGGDGQVFNGDAE